MRREEWKRRMCSNSRPQVRGRGAEESGVGVVGLGVVMLMAAVSSGLRLGLCVLGALGVDLGASIMNVQMIVRKRTTDRAP